jgi:hypothetical protein
MRFDDRFIVIGMQFEWEGALMLPPKDQIARYTFPFQREVCLPRTTSPRVDLIVREFELPRHVRRSELDDNENPQELIEEHVAMLRFRFTSAADSREIRRFATRVSVGLRPHELSSIPEPA